MSDTKRCCDCHEVLPLASFYQRAGRPQGQLSACCRSCLAIRCRKRRERFIEQRGVSVVVDYARRWPLQRASSLLSVVVHRLEIADLRGALSSLRKIAIAPAAPN
jgi:hypothetical protein